jgi:hypothetical protein
VLTVAAVLAGCSEEPRGPEVRVVDLLKQVGHAEKRPLDGAFPIAEHTLGGVTRASLVAPAASRVTWLQALPRRGTLRADVAVPAARGHAVVAFRLGISDDRIYETLLERHVSSDPALGWTTLAADLSRYAGPQFSLFYRPDRRRWRLVLAATPVEGSPEVVFWGAPGVDTDAAAARRFFSEHQASR